MKKTEIPIMFCFDNNYVIPAGVAFYSLLKHCNKDYYYKLYVLHTDITLDNQYKLKKCISEFKNNAILEFINMEHKFQDLWETISTKGHFSKEVMYKILVATIFPQYEKLIVSDVDVVFLNDISDSYFYLDTKEDYYLAGIRMIGKYDWYLNVYDKDFTKEEKEMLSGFCGGYIVFNLKKLREDNMEEKFIKCFEMNAKRINQMEQDILNLCCYPKTKKLPLRYLACSYMWDIYKCNRDMETDSYYSKEEIEDAMSNTVQLHYATSTKPWKFVNSTKADIWFKYLAETPFLSEYLKELPEKISLPTERIDTIKKELNNDEKMKIYYDKINQIKLSTIINNKLDNYRVYCYIKAFIKKPYYIFTKDFYKKIKKKLTKKYNNETIIILDDLFPYSYSLFRNIEYEYILKKYNNSKIYTTGETVKYFNNNYRIKNLLKDYKINHPEYGNRVFLFNKKIKLENCIVHMNFLHNAYRFLNYIEKNNVPFTFTLYPGGEFVLNDKNSDRKLKRIFSSKNFKYVIVTQEITYNYLLAKKLCPQNKIKYIFGVVSSENYKKIDEEKIFYKYDKYYMNICFSGNKYSKQGKDKGFDIFIECCKKLYEKYNNINYFIVGTFKKEDIKYKELQDKIIILNTINNKKLSEFYNKMDIIISPNRKDILKRGTFDGFPTASCSEAMLQKVALLATDPLDLGKKIFKNWQDIIYINHNVDDIIKIIEYLRDNPDQLKAIQMNGAKKARKIYSYKNQLKQREKIIINALKEKNNYE